MGEEEVLCVICLDGPKVQHALYLNACGCQASWFHLDCESMWLGTMRPDQIPPPCPTCRRPIQMLTNYCFWPEAGPDQLLLTYCLAGFGIETLYVVCSRFVLFGWPWPAHLSCQSLLLGLGPFVFPPIEPYTFYCHQLCARYMLCIILATIAKPNAWSFEKVLEMQIGFGYLHLFVVFLIHAIRWQHGIGRFMPFRVQWAALMRPYAISREVSHVRCLVAKTPPNSRKRNKRASRPDAAPP